MNYRKLRRFANSDLSEFENFIFNIRARKPVKAFGSAVHQHLLEPQLVKGPAEGVDMAQVEAMIRAGRADPYLSWIVQFSKKESLRLWEDPATGLPLKSKLDGVYKERLVTDLKTTSCRSREEFLKSCQRYHYDRQAAFYLDAISAPAAHRPRFCFLAIQKIKPFAVWRFDFATDSEFVEGGRKKYQSLLDELARRQRQGIPFIPSSWAALPSPVSLVSNHQTLTAV